jgi:uncharacterized membrane protein YhaH (DUF805 family)
MLKTYFGEWGTGRLQRLPYLGYHILLMVLIIASIFGAIMLVGTIENIIGGSLEETQTMLLDKFGIIGIIGIVVLIFITMLGQVNILGKRIRDMGLPVLWTILGIVGISMILNLIFPPEVSMAAASVQTTDGSATAMAASTTTTSMVLQIFDMIVFACLVFIPSDTFNAKNHF